MRPVKFIRRHMWIGGALLVLAAGGYLAAQAAFKLGFMGSH